MPAIDLLTGPNGPFVALIVVTTALFGWAYVGALRLCLDRYPPDWPGRTADGAYLRRGRRAWALCWTLAGFVALGVYRVWWLWSNPGLALPGAGTWVEAFRLAGGLYLVWAFWPRHGGEAD